MNRELELWLTQRVKAHYYKSHITCDLTEHVARDFEQILLQNGYTRRAKTLLRKGVVQTPFVKDEDNVYFHRSASSTRIQFSLPAKPPRYTAVANADLTVLPLCARCGQQPVKTRCPKGWLNIQCPTCRPLHRRHGYTSVKSWVLAQNALRQRV